MLKGHWLEHQSAGLHEYLISGLAGTAGFGDVGAS